MLAQAVLLPLVRRPPELLAVATEVVVQGPVLPVVAVRQRGLTVQEKMAPMERAATSGPVPVVVRLMVQLGQQRSNRQRPVAEMVAKPGMAPLVEQAEQAAQRVRKLLAAPARMVRAGAGAVALSAQTIQRAPAVLVVLVSVGRRLPIVQRLVPAAAVAVVRVPAMRLLAMAAMVVITVLAAAVVVPVPLGRPILATAATVPTALSSSPTPLN